jgi:hypothetical protein
MLDREDYLGIGILVIYFGSFAYIIITGDWVQRTAILALIIILVLIVFGLACYSPSIVDRIKEIK